MQEALQFIAPAELAQFKDLDLLARYVVEGLHAGLHRSPRSGVSIDFAHYRPYVQGDDPRYIDWDLYARTDRLHVKEFEHETNLRCTLLLDCSASMDYGSGEVTKFRYAQMLVACLALILNRQRDAFGFIAYHNRVLTSIPARSGPNHYRRILVELGDLKPAGHTDTQDALQFLGDTIPPRGLVVFVTDLLHPTDLMVEHLRSLRAQRHDVMLLQLSDEAERTFPFDRTVTLVDVESEDEQHAIPNMIREEYLANRKRHFDVIAHECIAAEIEYQDFATNEPLDHALRAFLRHRAHLLQTTSGQRKSRAGRNS